MVAYDFEKECKCSYAYTLNVSSQAIYVNQKRRLAATEP